MRSQKYFSEKISNARYTSRNLFEHTLIPYQSLNKNGCLIDVNNYMLEFLGYDREEVIEKWFGDFLSNDEVEKFVFERIRFELVRNPSSLIKPLREPEEGFHISFFLDVPMVETLEQRKKLLEYVNTFPEKMQQATTRGKMRLSNLVRKEATDFRLS